MWKNRKAYGFVGLVLHLGFPYPKLKNNMEQEKKYHINNSIIKIGFGNIVDHSNCFRDADDNTVCTFNPYTMDRVPEGITWIKMSDYSIYGMCTKTFVVIVRA